MTLRPLQTSDDRLLNFKASMHKQARLTRRGGAPMPWLRVIAFGAEES